MRKLDQLTAKKIDGAKPREKLYRITDGAGLYVCISPTGHKAWEYRYKLQGREDSYRIGPWPTCGLEEAREARDTAERHIRAGRSPKLERNRKRANNLARGVPINLFRYVALEWATFGAFGSSALNIRRSDGPPTLKVLKTEFDRRQAIAKEQGGKVAANAKTWATNYRRIEKYSFRTLGERDIATIEPADVIDVVRRVDAAGKSETAERTLRALRRCFRYAITHSRATSNPCDFDVRHVISKGTAKHFPAVTEPHSFGSLLRAVWSLDELVIRCGLQLLVYTGLRPGEIRLGRWSEIDWQSAEWSIPAQRMKSNREHVVPLSEQATNVLSELHAATGNRELMFPSFRAGAKGRAMSQAALNAGLARAGVPNTKHVPHGFRSSVSSLLHSMQYDHALIELTLSHARHGGDKIAAAYDRSNRVEERRKMLQAFADYVDELRSGDTNKVTAISAARTH